MEYRNKYYVVVRSRDSGHWNWAVDVDPRTVRGGVAVSEKAAVRAAERMIDRVTGAGRERLVVVSVDGGG